MLLKIKPEVTTSSFSCTNIVASGASNTPNFVTGVSNASAPDKTCAIESGYFDNTCLSVGACCMDIPSSRIIWKK